VHKKRRIKDPQNSGPRGESETKRRRKEDVIIRSGKTSQASRKEEERGKRVRERKVLLNPQHQSKGYEQKKLVLKWGTGGECGIKVSQPR